MVHHVAGPPTLATPFLALQSDERLAALVRDGHEQAFSALVRRHRPALVRRCKRLLGEARAEDAVQQALMNAHAALTAGTQIRTVQPWLHRVAQNAALNVLRALRDETPLDDEQLVTVASPADKLELSERLAAVLDAVRDLPETQRATLVLHELEGRSHAEIGAALGVSEGAARQQLSRARAAVRAAATAVTPYPLLAGALGKAGAVAGGAALAKLTAGVVVVGGAVGGAAVATDLPDRLGREDAPAGQSIARTAAASATSAPVPRAASVTLPQQASTVARERVATTPSRTASSRRVERAEAKRERAADALERRRGQAGPSDIARERRERAAQNRAERQRGDRTQAQRRQRTQSRGRTTRPTTAPRRRQGARAQPVKPTAPRRDPGAGGGKGAAGAPAATPEPVPTEPVPADPPVDGSTEPDPGGG